MNTIKVPRAVKGGGNNPNGYKIKKENLDSCIIEYLNERPGQAFITTCEHFDNAESVEELINIDMKDVVGTITCFDDEYMYVKPIEGKEESLKDAKAFISYLGIPDGDDKDKSYFRIKRILCINIRKDGEK